MNKQCLINKFNIKKVAQDLSFLKKGNSKNFYKSNPQPPNSWGLPRRLAVSKCGFGKAEREENHLTYQLLKFLLLSLQSDIYR